MGRLHKNVRKYSLGQKAGDAILGKKTMDDIHVMGGSAEAAYDANKASEKAIKDAANQPVIPMADEEELERVRRRRNARRSGGRASTVLTDETFG